MTSFGIEPNWILIGAVLLVVLPGCYWGVRAYRRRARRRALLSRLERIAFEAAHQVLVPDGMGGFIHIDHLLLTPRGILVLDTRRVAGLIFGGDQMSDWTVMGRGHRYTFDNPQPALYDRIAAVKALVGDVPVEGRLLFSNAGKFTKGFPKWVLMLDGIEVEFPAVDRGMNASPTFADLKQAWGRLVAQLRPSPHLFTNL
jgi:Nuclease-related domain